MKKVVTAHIYSLDGKEQDISLIEQIDSTHFVGVTQNGIKCSVFFNSINNFYGSTAYYADDVYGKIDKKVSFYATFGSSEKMPFQGGYVRILAFDRTDAVNIFNEKYGLSENGLVNCSDIYTEETFKKYFFNQVNLGKGEHEVIE